MSDIVERLRNREGDVFSVSDGSVYDQAADEIERLRERIAELQAQCGYMESILAVRGISVENGTEAKNEQ